MSFSKLVSAMLAMMIWVGLLQPAVINASTDRTSKFRVYQNSVPIMEFSDAKKATAYAAQFNHTYVEDINNRRWIYHNFPNYKVYQTSYSKQAWEFASLEAAIKEAKKWNNASIRELSTGGWVWDNFPDHPGFMIYQGVKPLPNPKFSTLDAAMKEAKKWANSFIIDLSTNRWVWDNIPDDQEAGMRSGDVMYQAVQSGKTTENWKFAFLKDAVNESVKWANSAVVLIQQPDRILFENKHAYVILQNQKRVASYAGLETAIAQAKKLKEVQIEWNGRIIWSNIPYYEVMQTGKKLGHFASALEATNYAKKFKNSQVITLEGTPVWDNLRELIYLGWNGSSRHDTILSQVSNTQGLNITSPTWFSLLDADGTLKDESDPTTVAWLRTQGIQIHPLVHNQFDAKLTSAFLANSAAQNRFIDAMITRLVELKVDGINIDFESMAGSDRDRYTAFVKLFAEKAKAKGLIVSIDLPRGNISWNHLSAYDHVKLAEIVDYIMIMAYDQYWRGSASPGPVSGLQWTEEGLQQFLSYGIPRTKLFLGVPFYVRVWELDADGKMLGNRAVFMKEVDTLLQGADVTTTFEDKFGLQKVEFIKENKRYIFWRETIETMKIRVALAHKYDLAGVAAWRLGYEPSTLWSELLRLK